jgi:NAD(P)-dependent dehydrogenase (short-subunit alcohol dehydrogenase family)
MSDTAIIVGAGPGLGAALALRFARAEMNVAMAARNVARIETLASEFSGIVHRTIAIACDATRESDVKTLFERVGAECGPPALVVYNAGAFVRKSVLDTTAEEFERCWRAGCLGGFLVGREAARAMLARNAKHKGTIIFTGATASLRGGALFHNLAVGKFGLRAGAKHGARAATTGNSRRACRNRRTNQERAPRPQHGRARRRCGTRSRRDSGNVLPASHAAAQRVDARARIETVL